MPKETIVKLLTPLPVTVIILQRNPKNGEIEDFSSKLGREAYDFSTYNESLEDMLALLSLLDTYIGVSNTNMHLHASLAKEAHVLVPHPPEWRWMTEGDASPWFPDFRVYHQEIDGDWTKAMGKLQQDLLHITS